MNTEYKTEEQLQFLYMKGKAKVLCSCGRIMTKQSYRIHSTNNYHLKHRTNTDESYLPTPINVRPRISKPLEV